MKKYLALFSLILFFTTPGTASAASFEVSSWIPYWQDTLGIKSATKNISDLSTIHPFAFTVESDGSLKDKAELSTDKWQDFFKLAERRKVDVIPTVIWSDGNEINKVLSDSNLRKEHINNIVEMVNDGDYAGVDIDYENKLAETIDYFSLFLEQLKDKLGDKQLTCAIEARTPPEDRFKDVPKTIEYANDYAAIGKYCDTVEIMAYDQQRGDLTLNNDRKGEPYIPVADSDWVEKVIKLALKDIPANKIMLGVPTYGRLWNLTVEPNWYKSYDGHWAANLPDLKSIASSNKVKAGRNEAKEMSFTYFEKDSPFSILNALPTPDGTRTGFEAAAKALLFANYTGISVPVKIGWYSDAYAVERKVKLAKKYDLKGVALFKIDGEEDKDIWKLF